MSSEAANELKVMVQLTGIQGATDYEQRMWILLDLVFC